MILADRHQSPGGVIHALPDGRFFSAKTAGKDLESLWTSEAFDDPWTPECLTIRYGSGRPIVWEEPVPVKELPMGLGYWEGCHGILDREGAIHLFGMRFLKRPKDREYAQPGEQRCDVYHLVSRDGGATWDGPRRVDYGQDFTGAVMNMVQLQDGRIVLPLEYFDIERPVGKYVSKSCYSDDGGRSWHHDSNDLHVPSLAGHSHSGAIEPVVAELNDGRVWMLIRTQIGCFYESFSADGRVWSEPQPSRFKSSCSPGAVERLRDGRLVFIWQNGLGPPYASDMLPEWSEYATESWCRQVLNAAVSHDDGKTWRGYREFARVAPADINGGRFGYPRIVELPDGDLLVTYGYHSADRSRGGEYLFLDPDRLDETRDREDFTAGLAGWSLAAIGGVGVQAADGEQALRLQATGTGPLGAGRNFPFAARGRLSFELRRADASAGIDLLLDETYWMPGDREREAALNVSVGPETAPSDSWIPVTVSWNVGDGQAELNVGGQQCQLPLNGAPLGLCYLTLNGRSDAAESGAALVRRLETVVED